MKILWPCYILYKIFNLGRDGTGVIRYKYSVIFVRTRWTGPALTRIYEVSHYEFWESFTQARKRFGLDHDEISIRDGNFEVAINYKQGPCIY